MTAGSFGAVIGGLIANKISEKTDKNKIIIYSVILQGLVLSMLAFFTQRYLILIIWLSFYIFNVVSDIYINVALAEETPRKIRGRVYSSINAISCGSGTVGSALLGPALIVFTSKNIFLVGGTVLVVLLLLLKRGSTYLKVAKENIENMSEITRNEA